MQVCVRLSLNSHVANEVIMNEDENGIERRSKQTANFKSSLRKEFFFYHEGIYHENQYTLYMYLGLERHRPKIASPK